MSPALVYLGTNLKLGHTKKRGPTDPRASRHGTNQNLGHTKNRGNLVEQNRNWDLS